jgi:DNA-binding transcriptional regulator YiaG
MAQIARQGRQDKRVHRSLVGADQIRYLRRRLAPEPDKPISQQRFGDLMGVAWSTVARWEGGSKPDAKMATKLARLHQAVEALGGLIVSEDRLLFFEQHHPLLLHMRPIDLLDTKDGAAAVMRLINSLESGAFS